MKTQSEVNQFVAREDVGFVLETTVKVLLAQRMTAAQITETITESAKRVLRLSLSDAGQKVSVADLDRQAAQIVKALVEDVQRKAKKAA
jgi:hypothetical protein